MNRPIPLNLHPLRTSHWQPAGLRLTGIALAIVPALLSQVSVDVRLFALAGGYAIVSAAAWFVTWRTEWEWPSYISLVADVAFVTALLLVEPYSTLPLWILYLVPIAIGSAAGRAPATLAAGLSAAGFLAATWLPAHLTIPLLWWPVAVLALALGAVSMLSRGWAPEWRERRFWPELVAATRGLTGHRRLDEAGELIVERARRLTRSDAAWLLWCDAEGRPRPGPVSGSLGLPDPLPSTIDAATLEWLAWKPAPLDELFGVGFKRAGDVIAVTYGDSTALLGVQSGRRSLRSSGRAARLQAFAPWAAEALTQALEWEAAEAGAAREAALRQAAAEWAATENPVRAQESALRALRAGIKASAAIIERATARILLGEGTIQGSLDRETLDWLIVAPDRRSFRRKPAQPGTPLIVTLKSGLALAASRRETALDEVEADWVEDLATGLSGALDRCAAHAAVESEAERLRAAAEATPAPVAIWDSRGQLVLANSTYSSLGMGLAPPAELPLAGPLELEITAGEPKRSFMITVVPVMGDSYILAHFREVTREREALRAKDELIAMVGHELRSPLTSIRGYSQMMSRQLRIVQSQVTQLDTLISDFVAAAQREAGDLPIAREPVELAAVARAAAERFRGAHEGRQLHLELTDGVIVEGDGARLGQIVDNLLSNAAKYSPPESSVTLGITRSEGQALLSVEDEGIGIAAEHLPALFDRFYRVPSSESTVKGLGLGLSIVRDLVAAHGGRVWAESQGEGRGSTFWVALPARTTQALEAPLEVAPTQD